MFKDKLKQSEYNHRAYLARKLKLSTKPQTTTDKPADQLSTGEINRVTLPGDADYQARTKTGAKLRCGGYL